MPAQKSIFQKPFFKILSLLLAFSAMTGSILLSQSNSKNKKEKEEKKEELIIYPSSKSMGPPLPKKEKPDPNKETNKIQEQPSKSSLAVLTLSAIGVVYGDIGTSVLYAMKEVFGSGHVPFTPENVYGILSIFFWTLTTIVSLKYVTLVLRADNHGEGGLVAMLALASQAVADKPNVRRVLLMIGIFGTCLFYGDGVITPAILLEVQDETYPVLCRDRSVDLAVVSDCVHHT